MWLVWRPGPQDLQHDACRCLVFASNGVQMPLCLDIFSAFTFGFLTIAPRLCAVTEAQDALHFHTPFLEICECPAIPAGIDVVRD